ncbi:inorganic diphosphatase PPA2 [Nakaseomyces bracarensis]|uniref:inorganic diphosphatase PPA2 n=1 Tax=Nakaseomyces bracarensis TaxID=273131 RepID=UPI0038721D9F
MGITSGAFRLTQLSSILNGSRRFYSHTIQGSKYSKNFKQYLKLNNGEVGSYFHDIPVSVDTEAKTVNMVVEVPRWSNGKFEISKNLEFNPIVQDVKKDKVRFVHNIFPYHGYIHNYGAIPQTWENKAELNKIPGVKDGLYGDNDPLDCCDIGAPILHMGDIKKVKVLGSLALIDDGELDWKNIVINTEDPLTEKVNSLKDVEEHFPGLLNATREWFRKYKIPMGKPENRFGFDGEFLESDKSMEVIQHCHKSWLKLIGDKTGLEDVTDLPVTKRCGNWVFKEEDIKPDTKIPEEVHKWYHV